MITARIIEGICINGRFHSNIGTGRSKNSFKSAVKQAKMDFARYAMDGDSLIIILELYVNGKMIHQDNRFRA